MDDFLPKPKPFVPELPKINAGSIGEGIQFDPVTPYPQLNRPLYQVADEYAMIVDHLVESGGEMTPENLALWDGIQGEAKGKLEACALMIRSMTSHAEAINAESKRLAGRARTAKNKTEWLKRYVKEHMGRLEIEKVEGVAASLLIQNNPASCEVLDESQVPPELTTVTITMNGKGWDNLQAVLPTIIPEGSDHFGGEWDVSRSVNKKAVIKRWTEAHEQVQTPGTIVSKAASLRLS